MLAAQGSLLTNKYAEGYPGKRYYGGCEFVDIAETIAIERAKQLFGAPWANVQPHSGSQANQAVYTAALKPGDTILGMSLAHGRAPDARLAGESVGQALPRGVLRPERGRSDRLRRGRSDSRSSTSRSMIVTGASAYSRVIDWQRFRAIADKCGALLMADMAHYAGLVAAGLYPSPVGIADFVTTTTHKTLRGPRGGLILGRPEQEKAINSAIFPGLQGGPLMHVIAAKAVAFGRSAAARFQGLPAQGHRQRARHGARRCRSAACASSPAAPTATCSCSTCGPRTSPARTPRTRSGART